MTAALETRLAALRAARTPAERQAALAGWFAAHAAAPSPVAAFRAEAFTAAAVLCRAGETAAGAATYAFAWGLAPEDVAAGAPDDHALLHAAPVRAYLEAILADRRIVFVTGCARSGTSLMQRCLATLHDPVYYWSENTLAQIWRQRRVAGAHLVLKRRAGCHAFFHAIPPGVRVVHMVREPAFVLTSRVRGGTAPYVTPERWRGEAAALGRLRATHLPGHLAIVRYEDLLAAPDRVQARLAAALDLAFDLPFARYVERDHLDRKIDRHTGVKRRWEPIDPDRPRRNRAAGEPEAPIGLGPLHATFCAEFGYGSSG